MKGLLFTYLLTYGGAATCLFRPYYGFLIYVCFSIIKPPALWFWTVGTGGYYSRIIGIALLAGWLVNGCGNWNLGRAKMILFCLFGFWGWMAVSTAMAPPTVQGYLEVENYGKIVLPLFAGLTLINTPADIWKLVWVIVASTGYVAYEYNVHYYSGGDADRFLSLDGNSLSIALMVGCGIAFYVGLFVQRGWRRWLLFLIAALIAHVPMAAMSRGGMLGLVAMAVVSFILMPKTKVFLAFYGLAFAVGLCLAGPSVTEEFQSTFQDTAEWENVHHGRMFMWKACFEEMMKHPVFGCGQDRWPLVVGGYGFVQGKEAHSLWAQTAAELGVPGICFLLGFYLCTMWLLWRHSRLALDPEQIGLSKAVILGLVGYMTSASFVTVSGFEIPYYVALVGAALVKLSEPANPDVQYPASEQALLAQHPGMFQYGTVDVSNTPADSLGSRGLYR